MKRDILWAPWRIGYVSKTHKDKQCIFCKAASRKKREDKKDVFLVWEDGYAIAILNIFPYNNGHILVAPRRHIADFCLLKEEEVLSLFAGLRYLKRRLDKILKPDGYNLGVNLSEYAGAGIKDHLHIHLLPRWKADTNFMPTLADTKVVSQSLEELHKRLVHEK